MVENSTKNHEKKEWEKQMKDYIVRATAANEMIRAFAVSSTGIVEEARQRHTTLPVITAALGRLLSAGAMMGAMMKGDDDIVTLGIRGDGPAQGLTVTADSHGNVKGYPFQPFVDIPRKYAHLPGPVEGSPGGQLETAAVPGPGTGNPQQADGTGGRPGHQGVRGQPGTAAAPGSAGRPYGNGP